MSRARGHDKSVKVAGSFGELHDLNLGRSDTSDFLANNFLSTTTVRKSKITIMGIYPSWPK
jgi:hypothetical protein